MTAAERHQLLTQIFTAVCDLQGEALDRELDRLCADHKDLKAEVRELLSFHQDVQRWLAWRRKTSLTNLN